MSARGTSAPEPNAEEAPGNSEAIRIARREASRESLDRVSGLAIEIAELLYKYMAMIMLTAVLAYVMRTTGSGAVLFMCLIMATALILMAISLPVRIVHRVDAVLKFKHSRTTLIMCALAALLLASPTILLLHDIGPITKAINIALHPVE